MSCCKVIAVFAATAAHFAVALTSVRNSANLPPPAPNRSSGRLNAGGSASEPNVKTVKQNQSILSLDAVKQLKKPMSLPSMPSKASLPSMPRKPWGRKSSKEEVPSQDNLNDTPIPLSRCSSAECTHISNKKIF